MNGQVSEIEKSKVLVWYADLTQLANFEYSSFLNILDDSEIAANNKLIPYERKIQHAISHLMLRIMLSKVLGIYASDLVFQTTKYGKPVLEVKRQFCVDFNITHTDGAVACILSQTGKVGIDMEPATKIKDVLLLSRYCLTPREQDFLIHNNDQNNFFIKLWVLKEAYLKAIGKGLMLSPQQVKFDPHTILDVSPKLIPNKNTLYKNWNFRLIKTIRNIFTAVCSDVCLNENILVTNVTHHMHLLCQEAR